MASIETVDFSVLKVEQTNVSDIVGMGGKNEKNDVLLIQTLIKLAGFSEFFSKKRFGLKIKDLPEPTGVFDIRTSQAILGFQRRMANRLLGIDGKVHPGNYKNRVLKKGFTGRVMAITLLNLEALDGALINFDGDVISAVKKIVPSIVFV